MARKTNHPMEEKAKIETEHLYKHWTTSFHTFLLQRTENSYHSKPTTLRRNQIQKTLTKDLPIITDDLLLKLYKYSMDLYSHKTMKRFNNTGFFPTQSEKNFQKTFESILESHSKYNHIELYSSKNYSKDLPQNQKMVIGSFIPDFIVFGLKQDGYSSVVFEIDGDSHVYKSSKDEKRTQLLEELDILTLSIPNDKTTDSKFIETIINDLFKSKSGPLQEQIKKHKRKIWCKTITCNLSLFDIEGLLKEWTGVDFLLLSESKKLYSHPKCPREIKKELKSILPKIQS